jgi:hypothetical protein
VNSLLSPIKRNALGLGDPPPPQQRSPPLQSSSFLVYKDKQPGRAANRAGILISAEAENRVRPSSQVTAGIIDEGPADVVPTCTVNQTPHSNRLPVYRRKNF